MTPAFTIILPHRRNPGNDAALAICLDCLARNTRNDFALIMDAAVDSPLIPRIMGMVEQATTEICVYHASDTFMAPEWDLPMLAAYTPTTFVTGVLVEPGAIGLHHNNKHKDFGRKPETFRRAEFETWANSSDAELLGGEGWYCPYLFNRKAWLDMGGLIEGLDPDHRGFTSADIDLFERWKSAGNQVIRSKSFAYHLQGWSDPAEQVHEKRDIRS